MKRKKKPNRRPEATWRLFRLFFVVFLFLAALGVRAEMSTPNFQITQDVVGSFGTSDSSTNFRIGDTGGEVATGPADAANFGLNAGFWQTTLNNPILQFSVTDDTVALGELDPAQVRFDTASFSVGTNARSGYVVEYFGPTLSFESNTVDAMSVPAVSSVGTEQFGFNLVANNNPAVGADPSAGFGAAMAGYDAPDQFKFQSGDVMAASTRQSQPTDFTMSFIGNIDSVTAAGDYSTAVTLVATGRY